MLVVSVGYCPHCLCPCAVSHFWLFIFLRISFVDTVMKEGSPERILICFFQESGVTWVKRSHFSEYSFAECTRIYELRWQMCPRDGLWLQILINKFFSFHLVTCFKSVHFPCSTLTTGQRQGQKQVGRRRGYFWFTLT